MVGAPAALLPSAPVIWEEAAGNLCFRFQRGDRIATEAAFAKAGHIVEIELVNNRVVPTPIEPRATIGSHDAAGDRLHLRLTGQGVHGIRSQLVHGLRDMLQEDGRVWPKWRQRIWSRRTVLNGHCAQRDKR